MLEGITGSLPHNIGAFGRMVYNFLLEEKSLFISFKLPFSQQCKNSYKFMSIRLLVDTYDSIGCPNSQIVKLIAS